MLIGKGYPTQILTEKEIVTIVKDSLNRLPVEDLRVLILIPDSTRTMPMAMMFSLFEEFLGSRVSCLDYLVALGTH